MAFMEKLKFWKREESFEPLGSGEFSLGKEPSAAGRKDDLGLGMDRTPGLGGTGSISSSSSYTDDSKSETGVSLMGPAYDRPPESGDLRHAPLAPMERPSSYGSGAAVNTRDIEMISAKLDAIRANIENINHRLERSEER